MQAGYMITHKNVSSARKGYNKPIYYYISRGLIEETI